VLDIFDIINNHYLDQNRYLADNINPMVAPEIDVASAADAEYVALLDCIDDAADSLMLLILLRNERRCI